MIPVISSGVNTSSGIFSGKGRALGVILKSNGEAEKVGVIDGDHGVRVPLGDIT